MPDHRRRQRQAPACIEAPAPEYVIERANGFFVLGLRHEGAPPLQYLRTVLGPTAKDRRTLVHSGNQYLSRPSFFDPWEPIKKACGDRKPPTVVDISHVLTRGPLP